MLFELQFSWTGVSQRRVRLWFVNLTAGWSPFVPRYSYVVPFWL